MGFLGVWLAWPGLAWPGLPGQAGLARAGLGWAGGGAKRGWGAGNAKSSNLNRKFNKETASRMQGDIFGFLGSGRLGWPGLLGWAGLGWCACKTCLACARPGPGAVHQYY